MFAPEISCILSAFNDSTIGTKVTDRKTFLTLLTEAMKSYDAANDRVEGQHFVMLPPEAYESVSAGVGHKTENEDDYLVRVHRGQPSAYLKREHAAEVEGLAVIVYTQAAYLSDPEIAGMDDEIRRIQDSACSHVIVAVLAFAGPKAPLSPTRLVSNLAGGNKEVDKWDKDEIVTKATESKNYYDTWCVVAD